MDDEKPGVLADSTKQLLFSLDLFRLTFCRFEDAVQLHKYFIRQGAGMMGGFNFFELFECDFARVALFAIRPVMPE